MKCLRPYFSAFSEIAECAIARFAYDQCSNSPTVVISMLDGQRRPSQPSYIPSVAEAAVGFNSLLASGCLDHGATRSFENPFAKWESEDFTWCPGTRIGSRALISWNWPRLACWHLS